MKTFYGGQRPFTFDSEYERPYFSFITQTQNSRNAVGIYSIGISLKNCSSSTQEQELKYESYIGRTN